MLSEKSKLQPLFHKVYGKKNITTFDTFYRINLTNRNNRMFFDVCLKTRKITSYTAGFVNFEIFRNIFLGPHPDGSWHINISGGKKTVHIYVQSPFGLHDFACMVDGNVMEGLTFFLEEE